MDHSRQQIEQLFATESRRVLATLIRLLGDFELAEDALQDAFIAALQQWPNEGIPANPRAWLVSAGRFKAIDRVRHQARFQQLSGQLSLQQQNNPQRHHADPAELAEQSVADDQLRLIFICCHPALDHDAQVALTLREVCGLTTEAIARAFLLKPATLAQRIVRAKQKIRQQQLAYEIPAASELPGRLQAVLQTLYLVFNEGYLASEGEQALRQELSEEALRLAELLVTLLPEPEAKGLLALMLLHHARRNSRLDEQGELVLLDQQDRQRWDQQAIARGDRLVREALQSQRFAAYTLQAAIAALHAQAPSSEATDWDEIVALYSLLQRYQPSPVVALNRAVAVAMRDGPAAGLDLIEQLLEQYPSLRRYHLSHAACADLYRRLGQVEDARAAYQQALALTGQPAEQRFLQRRLQQLAADPTQ